MKEQKGRNKKLNIGGEKEKTMKEKENRKTKKNGNR